jgi:hypothetical protein
VPCGGQAPGPASSDPDGDVAAHRLGDDIHLLETEVVEETEYVVGAQPRVGQSSNSILGFASSPR